MISENQLFANKPKDGDAWDVAIIGSGPAGLTAAIYTTRGAASTLIIGGATWGGQLMLTTEVDNYPGLPAIQGPALMQEIRDHALKFGAQMLEADLTACKVTGDLFALTVGEKSYLARSVIVSTGSETRWMGVPGESEFRGRGVSSCAPCDAPFFKDKRVAVVGGGDAAFEEAIVLAKHAAHVILIHRRDEFKAAKLMQARLLSNPKVSVFHCSEVVGVSGDKTVSSLAMKSWVGSKHVAEMKSRITSKYGGIKREDAEFFYWDLPIEGVFVAIGHTPATNMFEGILELDAKGYVVKHDREGYATATSQKGVFVAGDVHDWHYQQAITAAGFGCQAGMDVIRYLDDYTR